METIQLVHPHQLNKSRLKETVLALGFFDGVHIGHQKVIHTARTIAREKGMVSAVMTFEPHPIEVIKKVCNMNYLTPLKSKMKAIEALGIDKLYIVNFSEQFAQLTPQQFVDDYIIGLNVKHVVAGFDYTYGHRGEGTMSTFPKHGRGQVKCTVIGKVEKDDEKVSSTYIRQLLGEGKMEEIKRLLNKAYSLEGKVVHGDKRGRTIGFPTANLELDERYLLPKSGVYAVTATSERLGTTFEAVCNVGYKPTFNKDVFKTTIEVHLFDFNGDLYDEELTVSFHTYLREEQKFNDVNELIEQIKRDKREAEAFFQRTLNKEHS